VILAGDVGGTKTALGLFTGKADGLVPVRDAVLPSADFPGLAAVIADFLAAGPPVAVAAAAFGVAGPVVEGRCVTTNLPWEIDARALAAAIPAPRVTLVNDLEATAHGLLALPPTALATLQAGAPRAGSCALVAAGTGLGEALLAWDGRRHVVVPSEGGHADFAPRSELEDDLLRALRKELGHVSWERLLSGPGLVTIYRFLRAADGRAEPSWLRDALDARDDAAAVAEAALAGRDPVCVRALETFVGLYGAEAGNLALKALAVGGVFLAGGIAPRILPALRGPAFLAAFRDKGRLAGLMASIPVHVVLEPRTALLGAARLALAARDAC
jgi:glucokinase